jgi:hypothetical protein
MKRTTDKFMDEVFETIKHGDETHQAWLKETCESLKTKLWLAMRDRKVESAELYLSEYELNAAKEWNKKHLAEHHKGKEPYAGAIGGRCSYVVTYTGVGTMLSIECSICKHGGKDYKVYAESLTDFSDF